MKIKAELELNDAELKAAIQQVIAARFGGEFKLAVESVEIHFDRDDLSDCEERFELDYGKVVVQLGEPEIVQPLSTISIAPPTGWKKIEASLEEIAVPFR